MPSRFHSGAYDPELVKMMGDALDSAWARFNSPPKNDELAKGLMASAIIEAVEAGERLPEPLADRAERALRAAIKEDAKALGARPSRARAKWK
jgi:hypothetical protein